MEKLVKYNNIVFIENYLKIWFYITIMKKPLSNIFYVEYSNGNKSLCKTIQHLYNEYTTNTNDNIKYDKFRYIINTDKTNTLKDVDKFEKHEFKKYLGERFQEYKKARYTLTNKDFITERMESLVYNKLFDNARQEICN
jgi:hypothetical protein